MQFVILIVALAALLWGAAFILRGSLLTGCLVFLLVNACLGYYFLHFNVGPIPLSLDRVILVVLFAMFGLAWRKGKLEGKPLIRMDGVVCAFFIWLAVRTFTSDFREAHLDAPTPLWHLLVGYASPLLLYWIARQLPLNQQSVGLIQKFFIAFGVYLALTGVAEITEQWWAVFPKHIADPDVGLHFGRARGPMVQAVVYGFALTICLVCALVYQLHVTGKKRMIVLGCAALSCVGVLFCYTRCVWMGAALAIGVFVWLAASRRIRTIAVSAACVLMLLLATTQWDRLQSFSGGRSADASKDSASMRVSFAYVSWQMFKDNPMLGCGFGQYVRAKDAYLADRTTTLTLEHIRTEIHHNLFLSILVETGLIGLVLYLTMLGILSTAAWHLWSSTESPLWLRGQGLVMLAIVAAYIPNAVFQPLGHMNIVHMLFFFFGGVTSGLIHQVRSFPVHGVVAPALSSSAAWAQQA